MAKLKILRPFVGALIASALVLMVFGVILGVEHHLTVSESRSDARSRIEIQRRQIEAALARVETDVLAVTTNPTLREYALNREDPRLRAQAGEVLRTFAAAKGIYDQIRVIGTDGLELVRVNRTDSGAMTVPVDELQNKADRYYVTDGLALAPDGWYISPFDLNIEAGEIEMPRKPMIRLVRPLDIDGQRHGIVVLNYRGDELFESFRQANDDSPGVVGLANAAGWWLYVDDPRREWLFMFPEEAGREPNARTELGRLVTNVFSDDPFVVTEGSQIVASSAVYPFAGVVDPGAIRPWYLVYRVTKRELGIDLISQMKPLAVPLVIALVLSGVGGYLLFRSLQQRNDYRRQIERAAFIDELTRLPNRRYLYDNLNRMCEMMARYEQTFVTLFIDVDGFKPVNDQYGHDAGDEVLVEVAHRLKACVRTSDLVARLGGDEFVVTAVHVPDRTAAENVAGKALEALAEPIQLSGGETVVIGASIGIFGGFDRGCIESEVGMADEIIRRADAGMYVAKHAGKNRYAWAPE